MRISNRIHIWDKLGRLNHKATNDPIIWSGRDHNTAADAVCNYILDKQIDNHYTANQAIVALNGSSAEGATSIADLKDVKFGAQAGTTSFAFITDVIQPTQDVFAYDDNVGAKAALEANQIDAAVFDLPTALYVSGVEIDGSSVVGQFPAAAGGTTDEFGLLLEKDSPLTPCVDAALQALTDSGELAAITNEWLSEFTGAPVISE